ncbi:type I restriction endonuclease subunit R [Dysgonomonas sp. 520]|uniref:type I restriction endonuclease subunit R n=1 Tax=Dysgonomonas sp. 520 TaxID=2302931 RepID=UPI0013D89510|nr:type I restriction endonuclease subunit R [Dysgonomonas sp. 520]NDW11160.1 type I restriction endonuclease subunit R [Dysgonomonas sp. 520]
MIKEQQLERLALSWFQDVGYYFLNGADIAPESNDPYRNDYREVLLMRECLDAWRIINPQIPVEKLEEVFHLLKNIQGGNNITRNKTFHQLLTDGIRVEIDKNGKKEIDLVLPIDFKTVSNNRFLVVSQFCVTGQKQTRCLDTVIFINGFPLAVIELKNPVNTDTDVWDAFNQLQTYKHDIEDLFVYNEALVVSDGITARIGSLTANKERFLPWRTISNENDRPLVEFELEKVIKGFFQPDLFLDYIRHFILFEQEGENLIKKIAAYHQFHAVREAVNATVTAAKLTDGVTTKNIRNFSGKEIMPGNKKAGVIWHTQGSGKSISMVCYAGKLLQQVEMQNPTIVVVTDRSDLDGQLFNVFSQAADLLKQTPIQAESREDLRAILESQQSGGIIFTTIQKFSLYIGETKHPLLSERHNIVVISDEAHRSQYGHRAILNTKTGVYKYGFSQHLREALQNATFIGFTGTPIANGDKDTRKVFGEYISIYDIQDAVDDGATVPIFYESRLAKLDVDKHAIEDLSREVEVIMEDEEDLYTRENTKSKWTALGKLVGATPRLRQVAADLINHYEQRTSTIDGKAMIVCMSREICVHLYNEIVALRPTWHNVNPEKGAIKIIMTGSAAEKELLRPHIYSQAEKKRLEKRFKDPDDELRIVIVRDMWLTGFDVPVCHTMYIDKPMRGHNLMQAIARVNRVFKNKPGGLVVDYIGIANELKEALKTYADSDGKGSPTNRMQEAYSMLIKNMDAVRGMFHNFDYSEYETNALELLIPATNFILSEQKDGKKRFLDLMLAVNSLFSICSTIDGIKELRLEIAFFNAIRATIIKYTSVDSKRLAEEKNSVMKQIIDNAIIADGVADIFELAGLQKPNIGLLSPEFMEDVRNMKAKNLAVELLEKLLKDEIKSYSRGNIIQERKFGDRLLETLRKYHNRAIETAQVVEELIQMAKDFQQAHQRDLDLGLNSDEIRFYDALLENNTGEGALNNEDIKFLAQELTKKLRESTTVDWEVRDSVRAKIRNIIRRMLRKYGYPPIRSQEAIDLVIAQAEVLAKDWER